MRWGALLGVVACAAAPRGVAPVRQLAKAPSAAPRPTPPFPEYQLRAAALGEYVFEGRADRLHDRFLYTSNGEGAWAIERLAP